MDRQEYPSGIWLVLLFDLGLGGLLAWGLFAANGTGAQETPPPGALEVFTRFTDTLMWVTAGAMVSAAVCLLIPPARRLAALLQRGVFWCWVLILGSIVLALMLPREGGVGGFLLLIGLVVSAAWALLALRCFRYVRDLIAAPLRNGR